MNLHPKISEYTFISSAQGIFSRIKHILGYKGNLNKLKSIEIISNIFSGHNGMKLEINHRERNEKKLTTWRSNGSMRIRKEIKKHIETNDNEDRTKIYGMLQKQCSEGSS